MRLSDTIESFIKEMMIEGESGVELKRNELADYFHCAPSQINYVLSTRFTPDHGYLIESRRGGGGGIRIIQVINEDMDDRIEMLITQRIGDAIDLSSARIFLSQLASRKALTEYEAELIMSAISAQALSVPVSEAIKDQMRARILRTMLLTVVNSKKNR